MKSATTRKTAKKTSRRTTKPLPLGLVALMATLTEEDNTANAPRMYASYALPVAARIVRDLNAPDGRIHDQIESATKARYNADELTPDMYALTGFHVGVAAAWLLLTAMTGHSSMTLPGGAR